MTSVTDEEGDTVTYTYDEMGRVLTEQNPVQAAAGKDTAFTYDGDGNLLTVTDANGHTTILYVQCPQRRSEHDRRDGPNHELWIRRRGQLDHRHGPDGQHDDIYSIHDDNELSRSRTRFSGTTTYGYDLDDELTSVTDPNGFDDDLFVQQSGPALGRVASRCRRGGTRLRRSRSRPTRTTMMATC